MLSQQGSCQRQKLSAESVGEQAEVTDAHEAFWQHVQEEASQELDSVEFHDAPLATMRVVLPAEVDILTVEGGDPVVGDGDAMCVASQVTKYVFGAAEGRLGIDHPLVPAQLGEQFREPLPVLKSRRLAAAVELVLVVEVFEPREELIAEDSAQDRYRQQEERVAGGDPTLMVGRQSAARNDTVDMWMERQVRSPGMQDGEQAYLCTHALGIGGNFQQCLRACGKE